jgi:hypothetical protein
VPFELEMDDGELVPTADALALAASGAEVAGEGAVSAR